MRMSHIILMSRVLLDDLSDIIKTSNGSETWRNLVTYKNMLRAVESMAVEMSFGIIFIGNGKLSTADFARFIESHKVRYDDYDYYFYLHNVDVQLAEEYIFQSEGFLTSMRAILQSIKETPEYLNYTANYKQMVFKKNLTRFQFTFL